MGTNERKVFNLQEHGVKRGLSFGYYRYNRVAPGLEVHKHEGTLEICFCMKGHQRYKVGKDSFELRGGDIFIVPPDTLHSTGGYPEDKGELYWIQLLFDKSNGKLCNLPEDQTKYILNNLLIKSNHVFKGAFQLKLVLEKLRSHLETHESVPSKIMVNQLIVQLLLETIGFSQKVQTPTDSEKLKALDIYILQNLNRTIYVDELAEISHMSTGYFKSWFKTLSGMPPKEYVNRLRIEQAKIDLLKKRSVTQVAFDLGYSSSQYFATSFKKFTGHTPRKYIILENKN